ncbi:MAG: lamin tail domain-containing protein, partial [Candidatus Lloydbacteria bacterium]|nr:lamin tail domain-containing protein [Candidatus Lloydbacteria bacterium]
EWSLTLAFNQGTTTVQFFATDSAGNISAATSTTLFVDSIAPQAPAPAIAECASSLASSGCLVVATTLSISWASSEAADFNYFIVNNNGAVSTTTATSTTAAVANNIAYSFALAAIDKSGNASATTTMTAEINTSPVVINEVAWGGTNASAADEWVELYNKTASTVNLSGFTLYAADGAPYIPLSGSIPAGGYYLIERKNTGETDEATQSPVKDITADLWTSFGSGLSNDGENLILARKGMGATTTIDEIPYCFNWCVKGLGSPMYLSMERFDTNVAGTDWNNWASTLGRYILNGKDKNDMPISGTPKAKNSISYTIAANGAVSSNTTLHKASSPYLISQYGLTVMNGATLTIEPGVVVKIIGANWTPVTINGTLIAEGTTDEPVVFTAFADDIYGGDMNGDGICNESNASSTAQCPSPGLWSKLYFKGSGSLLSHTIVRYGGAWLDNMTFVARTSILDEGANITMRDSIVEYSGGHGLSLSASNGVVRDSVFRNNNKENYYSPNNSTGIFVSDGNPIVVSNTFTGNTTGLSASGGGTYQNNIFTNNTRDTLRASNFRDAIISGNSGSGNGTNAILLDGLLTSAYATTTLQKNGLPYLVTSYTDARVAASSSLVIAPGVTIKFSGRNMIVYGDLSTEGTAEDPVIFTSAYDNSDGNDALGRGANSGTVNRMPGVVFQAGSTSNISGAKFKFMNTALSYLNSPITLSDTVFSDNALAVSADPAAAYNYPITTANVVFNNNVEMTSPAQLW